MAVHAIITDTYEWSCWWLGYDNKCQQISSHDIISESLQRQQRQHVGCMTLWHAGTTWSQRRGPQAVGPSARSRPPRGASDVGSYDLVSERTTSGASERASESARRCVIYSLCDRESVWYHVEEVIKRINVLYWSALIIILGRPPTTSIHLGIYFPAPPLAGERDKRVRSPATLPHH